MQNFKGISEQVLGRVLTARTVFGDFVELYDWAAASPDIHGKLLFPLPGGGWSTSSGAAQAIPPSAVQAVPPPAARRPPHNEPYHNSPWPSCPWHVYP